MQQIDWTAVIVALVGSGGLLVALVTGRKYSRLVKVDRAAEERAAERVSAPATGRAVHDIEAFRMAQQAMNLANTARSDNDVMRDRLDAVEAELSKFRRSYLALYEWAQKRIVRDWQVVRQQHHPPDLPPDIHHPDT